MSTRALVLVAAAASFAMIGCEDKTAQPPLAPPKMAPAPAASPAPASPAAAAPNAAPSAAPAAAGTLDANVAALGVNVTLPAGWKRKPPANQMRLAEAEVPDASGDPAKASLVVFSSAGGSVEDNIARWSGQVRDAQGQPAQAKTSSRTVNGVKVTTVEMSGSFAGMGDAAPKPNWMLRGAIIETAEGLLFVKMTGPADSMAASAAAFNAMVDSVKK